MSEKAIATTETSGAAAVKAPDTREETRYRVPPVDIYETGDGLAVIVDLPGVEKDGADVKVENGLLTISGRVARPSDEAESYREFTLLDYYRQFRLSDEVDQAKIKAELKNGVLRIHLPQAEAVKPRQIPVQVG